MIILEEQSTGLAGDAGQDPAFALDDQGVRAQRAGGSGRLQADIAAADHGQALVGAQGVLEQLGVGGRAQGQHAGQVGAGDRQLTGAGAGGQDEEVVGNGLARGQGHRLFRAIDPFGHAFEAQGDVIVGVPLGRLQRERLGVGLALQPGLGQRRALIGQQRLVADQDDTALVTVLAQERGGRTACVARADDDDACVLIASALNDALPFVKNDAGVTYWQAP
jgi:hypothetical protein